MRRGAILPGHAGYTRSSIDCENPAQTQGGAKAERRRGATEKNIAHSSIRADRVIYRADDPFDGPRGFSRNCATYRSFARRRSAWSRMSRSSLLFLCAMTLIVTALAGSLLAQFTLAGELAASEGAAAVSTPRSQWQKGSVPYLYQTDPAWASRGYAGSTVEKAGCGPTCLSMAYVALTGNTDRDPASMSAFSQINGYVTDGLTEWALMTQGAGKLGLVSTEISADSASVADALARGGVVIASMRPGDFTTEGHFIVIAGLDDNGQMEVRDPNSPERSALSWDAARVLEQCAGLWSLTRA